MNKFQKISIKIHRRWHKVLYQPIRVFVFHHVSDVRDPLICAEEDWTQLDQFKRNIETLSQRYIFISLSDAYEKLKYDRFRFRNYAVLTNDDGLASVLNILPWLEVKGIPLTLFINTRYMERDKLKPVHLNWLTKLAPDADTKAIAHKMYLSRKQIFELSSSYIEIGLHGHEHLNAPEISETEFEKNVEQCEQLLINHPRYVSAYAYPWGHSTTESLSYLHRIGVIPIVVRGGMNYSWSGTIDRECIDNKKL